MKIKYKFPILIMSIVLTLFLSFSGTLFFLYRNEGIRVIKQEAGYQLDTQVSKMELIFNKYIYDIKTLSTSVQFLNFIEEDIRRPYLNNLLSTYLKENLDILSGVWIMSEKNSIDSLDEYYINTYNGNDVGKYNPIFYVDKHDIGHTQTNEEDFYEDYYIVPITTKQLFITEPYTYSYDGVEVLMVSFCYPVSFNNETNIVIGFDVAVSTMVANVLSYKPFDIGYTFLLNDKGNFIAHPASQIIGKNIADVDPEYNKKYNVLNNLKAHLEVSFDKIATATGLVSYTLFKPFNIAETYEKWFIAFSVPLSAINEKFNTALRIMVLYLIIILFILGISVFFSTSFLTKKITILSNSFKSISSGEADLTKKLHFKSKDEIGDIGDNFNIFLEKLSLIVSNIRDSQNKLIEIASELSSSAEEASAATNQMSSNMMSLEQITLNQVSGATESDATVLEISKNIQKLKEKMNKQKQSIIDSTSNIEEIVANIASVSKMIKNVNNNFMELAQVADVSKTQLNKTLEKVDEILTLSKKLNDANTTIQDIASRTSILSINAGISAAHAGDYGRGFKVIAEEVRRLAEDATSQSKIVRDNISTIQNDIKEVEVLSSKVKESFDATLVLVSKTTQMENEANSAMDEQAIASNDVLNKLKVINHITEEVNDSFNEVVEGSSMISKEMNELIELSSILENSVKETSLGIKEINSAISLVSDSAQKNKIEADNITENIGKFKI